MRKGDLLELTKSTAYYEKGSRAVVIDSFEDSVEVRYEGVYYDKGECDSELKSAFKVIMKLTKGVHVVAVANVDITKNSTPGVSKCKSWTIKRGEMWEVMSVDRSKDVIILKRCRDDEVLELDFYSYFEYFRICEVFS